MRAHRYYSADWSTLAGKTQTLVEIIRQCVRAEQSVLVCGASNLAVDNILARLSVPHPNFSQPIPLTRVGHPARVLAGLGRHTLDAQSASSDTSALLDDIKKDLETLENQLRNGTGKTRVKGSERKKMWEEVRELRKEFRKRQGGVVSEVVSKAKVVLATTHGCAHPLTSCAARVSHADNPLQRRRTFPGPLRIRRRDHRRR